MTIWSKISFCFFVFYFIVLSFLSCGFDLEVGKFGIEVKVWQDIAITGEWTANQTQFNYIYHDISKFKKNFHFFHYNDYIPHSIKWKSVSNDACSNRDLKRVIDDTCHAFSNRFNVSVHNDPTVIEHILIDWRFLQLFYFVK